mgnify:CR=1 FL=1
MRLKEFEKELRKLGKLLGGDSEVLVLSGRPQEFDEAVVESQMVTKSNNVWRIREGNVEKFKMAIIVG